MENQKATVPVRVKLGAVKVHGPNSPAVLDGSVPEGHRERLETEGPTIQQIDYETAVKMFGREKADDLFQGVPEEDR
jgi:hypothetical protein